MKVLGKRIYLDMPNLPETKIELSPEFKKQQKEELAKKFDKLAVFAVGDEVTKVKAGDIVCVDPFGLQRGRILVIDNEERISVVEDEILHIW